MARGREREFKLVPPEGYLLPDLDRLVPGLRAADPVVKVLGAVYFDTEDLRLTRAGASLRYRPPEGWTVKLPATTPKRGLDRHELTLDAPAGLTPPAAAQDLVQAWTRGSLLRPVAELVTVRMEVDLLDESGRAAVHVAHDRVGGARAKVSLEELDGFVELEVEAAPDADPSVARRVVDALAGEGILAGTTLSKVARALGGPALDPAETSLGRLAEDADVSAYLRHRLGHLTRELLSSDALVRLDGDPDDVHRMRVAIRSIRSELHAVAPLLRAQRVGRLDRELTWVAGELGGVRDADVLAATLDRVAHRAGEPAVEEVIRLRGALAAERSERSERLLTALRSPRYPVLLDSLVAACAVPPVRRRHRSSAARTELPPLAGAAAARLCAAVDRLGADPDPRRLHRVRIRVKRLRYLLEGAARVPGVVGRRPMRRLARRLAELGDHLGELNDAVVAHEWLRSRADREEAPRAFVLGEVAGVLRSEQLRLTEGWPTLWERVERSLAELFPEVAQDRRASTRAVTSSGML